MVSPSSLLGLKDHAIHCDAFPVLPGPKRTLGQGHMLPPSLTKLKYIEIREGHHQPRLKSPSPWPRSLVHRQTTKLARSLTKVIPEKCGQILSCRKSEKNPTNHNQSVDLQKAATRKILESSVIWLHYAMPNACLPMLCRGGRPELSLPCHGRVASHDWQQTPQLTKAEALDIEWSERALRWRHFPGENSDSKDEVHNVLAAGSQKYGTSKHWKQLKQPAISHPNSVLIC